MATRRRRMTSTVTGSIADVAVRAGSRSASVATDNVYLPKLADLKRIARPDQCARSVFNDHRRPLTGKTRAECIAIIDTCRHKPILLKKVDGPDSQFCSPARAVGATEPCDLGLLHMQRRERV